MTDYNKIITTVNSITPDYQFIPDLNNTIVIDTSENRIGINTITPDENIHVSGGTIKTQDLIVLGDLSVNNFSSDLIPRDDLSYNIGSIDYRWNDLFVGSGTFNAHVDVSGVLHIKQSLTADGLVTTGTKIYTIYENNSAGNPTTRLIIDPSGDGIPGSVAEQGEVVIMGNLDVKGTSTFIQSTNVDISNNIIRMNANHNAITYGGIAVKNSSNVDKLFTYNNPGDYWTTNDTNINLGPNGGVVTSGFMNIDNVNINGNTIDVDSGDLVLKSDTGQVVVEQVTFSSNTISTTGSLNLTAAGGDIFTQNTNLDLGTGVLTVNGVVNAHVPTGAIILWYGTSGNVPTGWAICNGEKNTPNLSGKFVVCSGSSENSYSEGGTGGQNFPTLTEQQIPAHNHGASSQHSDVNHNHPATSNSGERDVNHNHPATSNSEKTSIDHIHTAASSSTSNSTSNSTLVIGEDGQEHTHPEAAHAHPSGEHTHSFSIGNHTHPGNINFRYARQLGGNDIGSIFIDDQNFGTLNLQNVGGSLQIEPAGAVSDENTGKGTGNTGNAAGNGTGNADSNHTHRNSSVNTTTNTTTNTDTKIAPEGGSHNHPITTNTGHTSINHNHPITTNTGHTTIDHNHVIQTQQTGGGKTFDNRPEYYSLWYIMKL